MTDGLCEMCGMGWCGRPCLRDPRKSNALLFHKDGRLKTLKERGLAWDSPPVKVKVRPMRVVVSDVRKTLDISPWEGSKPERVTKKNKVTAGRGRPKLGDKPLSAAEKMRRHRARKRAKPP